MEGFGESWAEFVVLLAGVSPQAIRLLSSILAFKSSSSTFFTLLSLSPFCPAEVELVDAVSHLRADGRNVRLRMINAEYPVVESRNLIQDVKDQIVRLGLGDAIEMDTGFLPDKVALSKLTDCDLIVFGYQRSSESASA